MIRYALIHHDKRYTAERSHIEVKDVLVGGVVYSELFDSSKRAERIAAVKQMFPAAQYVEVMY